MTMSVATDCYPGDRCGPCASGISYNTVFAERTHFQLLSHSLRLMSTPRAQKFTHRSIQILPKPYRVMIVYIPRDTPKDNSVLIDGIKDHKTVQYSVKYAIQQFCCDLMIITSKLIRERIP